MRASTVGCRSKYGFGDGGSCLRASRAEGPPTMCTSALRTGRGRESAKEATGSVCPRCVAFRGAVMRSRASQASSDASASARAQAQSGCSRRLVFVQSCNAKSLLFGVCTWVYSRSLEHAQPTPVRASYRTANMEATSPRPTIAIKLPAGPCPSIARAVRARLRSINQHALMRSVQSGICWREPA